jgi:outer membrane lipoprotein carrier protein
MGAMRQVLSCIIGVGLAVGAPTFSRATPDPSSASPGTSGETSAEAAVRLARKVQSFYDATKTLEADFVQTYFKIATSRTLERRGRLSFKKPRRLRWSYASPRVSEWVVRGDTLWWYEPEQDQMVVQRGFDSNEAEQSLAFLTGEGRLSETFRVAWAEPGTRGLPEGLPVLALTPKASATYERLLLAVQPDSGKVRGTVLLRRDGNVNRFVFRNIRTGQEIPDDRFRITPPEGTDVIER